METGATDTGSAETTTSHRMAVVIPCYNDGAFLLEALESLREQEPHELVVVDDGSFEPDTLEILERLAAEGIHVHSQENAGLGPARMAGVRATRSSIVHFLDSDDLLPPGTLTVLADALEQHPEASVAWGHYRSFGVRDCLFPTAPELDPWRITFFDEIPGTCMVRRETIEAVGGWDDLGYEDWDFWMKVAEKGYTGVGVPVTTLLYREHPTPRLLASTLTSHDKHYELLRERHATLFAARPANRRASSSPASLKLLWTAIDRLPLKHFRKRQILAAARYFVQREMSSDCYQGPFERLRGVVRRRLSGRPLPEA
ncbi:MAG TPA: glycosyltransferase family A protein [Thermoleophilaceae bacterium]|nr:glycosyltransferase family A protein [Thermoleophilaceae bacterium]